jgi:DNA-binding response OmpR family regulator
MLMTQHILVMNDNQEILDAFQMLLEDEGYSVTLASYIINDMNELRRIRPDLIILDFMFEGKDGGWQMIQLLKMHKGTADIPVIICTAAQREVRDIESFLQSKGVGIVYKPFDIEELLEAVRRSLRFPETIASLRELMPVMDDDKHDGHRGG